jgi:hypothetical protein
MGNGHQGLEQIILKQKARLKTGDCALFINSAWTAVKIYVDGQFVAHYKHPSGTIAPETIKHLPHYLNGSEIEYKKALAKVIEDTFKRRNEH